jgi:hypothetical protein
MEKVNHILNDIKQQKILEECLMNSPRPERTIIAHTGKGGKLNYERALCEAIGMTEEETNVRMKHLEETLPEGCYTIGI